MKAAGYGENPHYFLAAYTIRSPWVLWAVRRSGLMDTKPRPPGKGDVLEPDTLRLLPRPVVLSDEETHP